MSYVYAYLRTTGTPYYIGKGVGKRAWTKLRGEVRPPQDKSRVVILQDNLSDSQAIELEKQLILLHGRIDMGTGCLHNKTEGGDGVRGGIRTPEHNAKIAKAIRKKWQDPQFRASIMPTMKGPGRGYTRKPPSAKTRLLLSQRAKERYAAGLSSLPDNTGRIPWNKKSVDANLTTS
jgi:hypothetical protein